MDRRYSLTQLMGLNEKAMQVPELRDAHP
jgi:hypothetical protein